MPPRQVLVVIAELITKNGGFCTLGAGHSNICVRKCNELTDMITPARRTSSVMAELERRILEPGENVFIFVIVTVDRPPLMRIGESGLVCHNTWMRRASTRSYTENGQINSATVHEAQVLCIETSFVSLRTLKSRSSISQRLSNHPPSKMHRNHGILLAGT